MFQFFFLAFLNLALGFAAAMYLRRQLDRMPAEDADPIEETSNEDTTETVEEEEFEEIEADLDTTPGPECVPEDWTESLFEESILAESLVEAAIHILRLRVRRFLEEVIELTISQSSFKSEDQSYDANELQKCLVDTSRKWSEFIDTGRGVMDQHFGKFGRLSDIQVLLDTGISTHQLELNGATKEAESAAYGADFDAARETVNVSLRKIISSATVFGDYLDELFSQLIVLEERFDEVDKGLLVDSETSLLNRCGLNKATQDYRAESKGNLSGVYFSIDDLANLSYFEDVFIGDRIIQCIARILDSNIRKSRGFDRMARLSKGRLFLLLGDTEGSLACHPAERLRKLVSNARFLYGRAEMEITTSAVFGECEVGETLDEFISRLEQTLENGNEPDEGNEAFDTTWSLLEDQPQRQAPNDDPVRSIDAEIDVRQAAVVEASS